MSNPNLLTINALDQYITAGFSYGHLIDVDDLQPPVAIQNILDIINNANQDPYMVCTLSQ